MEAHTDRKDHLLDIAEELFSENGFDATSVRALAERAGMNVAMVSYYFGSKEKLFEAVIIRKTAYIREKLMLLAGDKSLSAWEKMRELIGNYTERILNDEGRYHKMMMRELSLRKRTGLSSVIEEKIMTNMNAVYSIVKEGIKKGEFRKDVDFTLMMSTIFGTLTHSTTSSNLLPRFFEVEKRKPKITKQDYVTLMKKHLEQLIGRLLLVHPEKFLKKK
ncbi:MAG TPA: TetR family transcriptional regulator [Bacteroidia bacterium]|nr:TetR family transcriptional regulator [Bacteroidia bacterium]